MLYVLELWVECKEFKVFEERDDEGRKMKDLYVIFLSSKLVEFEEVEENVFKLVFSHFVVVEVDEQHLDLLVKISLELTQHPA